MSRNKPHGEAKRPQFQGEGRSGVNLQVAFAADGTCRHAHVFLGEASQLVLALPRIHVPYNFHERIQAARAFDIINQSLVTEKMCTHVWYLKTYLST